MMKDLLFALIKNLIFLPLLIIYSCSGNSGYHKKKQLKGEISISGAFALYPIAVLWADEFKKVYPEVEIDISAGGAGKGMADVLSGMTDLGMVSRSINPAEVNKGAWSIAVVIDAVVPTISSKNPNFDVICNKGISKEQLRKIYITKEIIDWGAIAGSKSKESIHVFTRSDACGAGEMWGKFLESNQEGLQGVGVFGDPGMADAVKNEPNSIGYNNVIYAYDLETRKYYNGISVIPLDLNGNGEIDKDENFYDNLDSLNKAIQMGKFPSPPSRELYFVSKGKPKDSAVKEFLRWILTDGQKYVKQAGYVELSDKKREEELTKIKFSIKNSIHTQ